MSTQAPIVCHWCNEPIESKSDLRVTGGYWALRAYHAPCLADEIKAKQSWAYRRNVPVNTNTSRVMSLLLPVLVIAMYILTPEDRFPLVIWILMGLASLIPLSVLYRVWWDYERRFQG